MRGRLSSFIRLIAINVLILAALLIVVEGVVSWFLVVRDVVVLPGATDTSAPYTQYDPELGWVSKPKVSMDHMFGNGTSVRTNSRGFRNVDDTAPAVPAGRYRVFCSGDSFTFGDGVDNDRTWCQQLNARDPRIEPVNLGVGGYGADQAYLRFLRDTRDLQYQAHVFAFIPDDFVRMEEPTFLGFGRPVLAVERGELVTRNVPVPVFASRFPWLTAIPRALNDTRTHSLIARIQKKASRPGDASGETQAQRDERMRPIIRLMFADMKRRSEADGGRFVLLYLSFINDLRGTRPNPWTAFLEETARELQIPFVNVFDEMRARDDVQELFLSEGTAGGHYSNAGHALVADILYERLRETMR
jgi:hypothetical protein